MNGDVQVVSEAVNGAISGLHGANERLTELRRRVAEGNATRWMVARLDRLVKEQQRDSLGRLAKLFETFEFRDDELFSARLKRRPKEFIDCLEVSQWSTIQQLDLGSVDLPELNGKSGAFFNSLPKLHTLVNLNPRLLPEVPCPRITRVAMAEADVSRVAQAFPELRELTFSYISESLAFWGHPFIEGLDSVTLGRLTWCNGTLSTRSGYMHTVFGAWVAHGPPLHRMELHEDELLETGELHSLRGLLAAARRKGAEVVVMPPPRNAEYDARGHRVPRAGWSESIDW